MKILGGKHKGKTLFAPKSSRTRPTLAKTRETLFNICQFEIEGALFLDLFAGSGAVGLEAISRGASVTFIEQLPSACQVIHRNLKALKEEAVVLQKDVFKMLDTFHKQEKRFDIIFADPPYGKLFGDLVLEKSASLLQEGGSLFIEDTESREPEVPLKLKSQRNVGKATLRHFIRE